MIKLIKLVPHSWAMAVGDKRKGARYAVLSNEVHIGDVEKYSSPSYRSDGTTSRIRYGLRGYVIEWRATFLGTEISREYSRKAAIEKLIQNGQKNSGEKYT